MNIGKLDRRIELMQRTVTESAEGQPVITRSAGVTVWAGVRPILGAEKYLSDRIVSISDTVFTIRFRANLDTTYTIRYAGDLYDVQGIAEIGRHEGLQIAARKVA